MKKEVTLVVGKSYRNRMGEVVKIVRKWPYALTIPYVSDKGDSYQGNGKFFCSEDDAEDLIEEVLKLKVGKSYLNRLGEVVKIVLKAPYSIITFPYFDEKGDSYQRNGEYLLGKKSPEDLIEEVPTESI